MNYDLACGQNKREGYHGIDYVKTDAVDTVCNLLEFPWPIEDSSADSIHCSHFVEHIPHDVGIGRDGFFAFFDEVWRICRHDAEVEIIHPYAKNDRAFQDPTHQRFINETVWYYLNREWRKMQGLDHYKVECDFEVVVISGLGVNDQIMLRSAEAVAFSRNHYWNVVADLHVKLRTIKV